MQTYTDTLETIQGARAMLKRASTINDVKYFTTMVSKAFRKPTLEATFGAELAPIKQVQENLGEVKKADMTLEDYKHWFESLKNTLITSLSTLETAFTGLSEEDYTTLISKRTGGGRVAAPKVAYVTINGDKVLTSDAVNLAITSINWVEVLTSGQDLNDVVAAFAKENEVDDDGATTLVRAIGAQFKNCEKNVRYRAERADKGEPKPKQKA